MVIFRERAAHSVNRMSVCNLSCFPYWFPGQDIGSDCVSSWSFYSSVLLFLTPTISFFPLKVIILL